MRSRPHGAAAAKAVVRIRLPLFAPGRLPRCKCCQSPRCRATVFASVNFEIRVKGDVAAGRSRQARPSVDFKQRRRAPVRGGTDFQCLARPARVFPDERARTWNSSATHFWLAPLTSSTRTRPERRTGPRGFIASVRSDAWASRQAKPSVPRRRAMGERRQSDEKTSAAGHPHRTSSPGAAGRAGPTACRTSRRRPGARHCPRCRSTRTRSRPGCW